MQLRAAAAIVFVLGLLSALIGVRNGIGLHDEGLMLQWGARISGGEVPYRDFWMNYMPGQPVVQSLLGDSLVTWRIVRAVLGAAAAVCVTVLVARGARGQRLPLACGVAAALTLAWPLTPAPTVPALLLALLALLAAPRSPVGAGVLTGLAFVFRPEIGIAALVAVLLTREDRAHTRRGVRVAGAAAATAGVLLLPVLVLAGREFADQVLGFVAIQDLQRLPIVVDPGTSDPNKVLERLLPALLLLSTALLAAQSFLTRRAYAVLPLLAVGAAYISARADEFHVVPLSVFAVLAAGTLAARRKEARALVLPVLVIALVAAAGVDRFATRLLDARDLVTIAVDRAGGTRADARTADSIAALDRYVRARIDPRRGVLVLPPRTDRVRAGAPLVSILIDRPNPTRYDVMQPGVVTTREVQREMIGDLRRSRAAVVRVFDPSLTRTERSPADDLSGAHDLDRYIARNYRPAARAGIFLVLEPRAARSTIAP